MTQDEANNGCSYRAEKKYELKKPAYPNVTLAIIGARDDDDWGGHPTTFELYGLMFDLHINMAPGLRATMSMVFAEPIEPTDSAWRKSESQILCTPAWDLESAEGQPIRLRIEEGIAYLRHLFEGVMPVVIADDVAAWLESYDDGYPLDYIRDEMYSPEDYALLDHITELERKVDELSRDRDAAESTLRCARAALSRGGF